MRRNLPEREALALRGAQLALRPARLCPTASPTACSASAWRSAIRVAAYGRQFRRPRAAVAGLREGGLIHVPINTRRSTPSRATSSTVGRVRCSATPTWRPRRGLPGSDLPCEWRGTLHGGQERDVLEWAQAGGTDTAPAIALDEGGHPRSRCTPRAPPPRLGRDDEPSCAARRIHQHACSPPTSASRTARSPRRRCTTRRRCTF